MDREYEKNVSFEAEGRRDLEPLSNELLFVPAGTLGAMLTFVVSMFSRGLLPDRVKWDAF